MSSIPAATAAIKGLSSSIQLGTPKIIIELSIQKNDSVSLGSEVAIQKEGEKEVRKYSIVGSEEADMQDRKISHLSPLGEAMMDKKKGDTFTFTTPNGKMNYKIVGIK